MPGKRKTITARQKAFADEFIKTRNVYRAAINAGYAETYARSGTGANKLIDNPQIQKYIERRVARADTRLIATQEEVLYGLTRVFRREETEDVVTADKEGNVTVTKVRNNVSDSMKAGNDLLKIVGRTTQSKLEMAKLRKALAEAKLAERKANNADTSDVTIQIVPWEDDG